MSASPSRRAPAFPSAYKGSPGSGSLLSYHGVGSEASVLPEDEGSRELPDPRPSEAKVPVLGFPSSPHPQALGAGWRPCTARVEKLETKLGPTRAGKAISQE